MAETMTYKLAEFAAGVKFEQLSEAAVVEAKRFLIDSIGCALGGLHSHDAQIALRVLSRLAGPGNCHVLGDGQSMDPVSATLMNALLVRNLDFNDIYWKADPSHPSDLIPVALAACEDLRLSGRELLVGIVLCYEMEMRLCEFAKPGIRERGWHHATLTAFAAPLVAGRMYGLDARQIQHAIGISASHSATLGAVTAGKLTNMKNTVDPMASQAGILAALLAKEGYSGPEHVLDGKEGLTHCLGPAWDLDVLTAGLGASWRITQCSMKAYPTEALTHAPISIVLALVRDHGLDADQVESVEVRTLARAADILSDPSKYDPKTKETADHSLPWCLAAAIADGRVTTEQFSEHKLHDPRIRSVLPRIKVVADPEIEAAFPARQICKVTIRRKRGASYSGRVEYPKGDPRNPLTHDELLQKFDGLTSSLLGPSRRQKLLDAVEGLDKAESIERLMDACRVRK
jgi:2-methylcitrate dehydratase